MNPPGPRGWAAAKPFRYNPPEPAMWYGKDMGLLDRTQDLIRVFPPGAVTSMDGGAEEVDPRAAGLTHEQVERIWQAVVQVYRTRLHPAISITLHRRGLVVLDRAIGHLRGNSPRDVQNPTQATPGTLFNLFSASKMITAMVIHLLDQRSLLELDDPVADYIPEFAQAGKHRITIADVLCHRAGVPYVPADFSLLEHLTTPDRIVALLCELPPSGPDRQLAYHALTGGFLLAELVLRITGRNVRDYLRDEILAPLGFAHCNYGVARADGHRVAVNAFTGMKLLPGIRQLFARALSIDYYEAVRLSNSDPFLHEIVPSANIISTTFEAARFMELLLRGGTLNGVHIFDPGTIARATTEQSYLELDRTLFAPVRFGMGFMLGTQIANIFGLRTPRLFGHHGMTANFLCADPERDISLAIMTTGKPAMAPGMIRFLQLMQTIAATCPRDYGRG